MGAREAPANRARAAPVWTIRSAIFVATPGGDTVQRPIEYKGPVMEVAKCIDEWFPVILIRTSVESYSSSLMDKFLATFHDRPITVLDPWNKTMVDRPGPLSVERQEAVTDVVWEKSKIFGVPLLAGAVALGEQVIIQWIVDLTPLSERVGHGIFA